MSDGLPLAEAIESLRREIQAAVLQADGVSPGFTLENIELELQLVASTAVAGKAGASIWRVLTAEVEAERRHERTHRVLLTLKPDRSIRVNR
jgi:hypothetical protein